MDYIPTQSSRFLSCDMQFTWRYHVLVDKTTQPATCRLRTAKRGLQFGGFDGPETFAQRGAGPSWGVFFWIAWTDQARGDRSRQVHTRALDFTSRTTISVHASPTFWICKNDILDDDALMSMLKLNYLAHLIPTHVNITLSS